MGFPNGLCAVNSAQGGSVSISGTSKRFSSDLPPHLIELSVARHLQSSIAPVMQPTLQVPEITYDANLDLDAQASLGGS